MSGAVIENLSGRKLTVIVAGLLVCQVVCFLIGGLIAPLPSNVQSILATVCLDDVDAFNDTSKWLWTQSEGSCRTVANSENGVSLRNTQRAVFVFQMPMYDFDFSRWQQSLIGMLQLDLKLAPNALPVGTVPITLDARLAYSNKGSPGWHRLATAVEVRHLECETTAPHLVNCHPMALFELGSLHHDYYLLNLRLPVDTARHLNLDVEEVIAASLTTIFQNGGFTKVWISLKCAFAPITAAMMIWFWHRVALLKRRPVLLEWMLLALAGAITFLNLPVELLTLSIDMPFMLLLADVRQGVFYATLLCFWLIFAGEHLMIQETQRSTLRTYWRHLSAVLVACVALFAFDMCERGVKLRNPFYSVWTAPWSSTVASVCITVAAVSAAIYFLFLCFMVYRVMRNIGAKRGSLSTMSAARRLRYAGIIYRFQFLMLATVVCAALTVIGFIMGQVDEQKLKWSENGSTIEVNSAFLTGVYGMWNVYIIALLALYAPSHKKTPEERPAPQEEIEFSNFPAESNPSEISSLTSFSRKAAFD
ncbi:protein wntless [Phlebotomus argentipes]|uniref:protein wntless n=1 Tax=Phlebotomus argentipes TaxID=94469 RepID=UPI002892AE6F|nr:protein wntless [Phlebotomus argentipes]